MTAGHLREILAQVPEDAPVRIDDGNGDRWPLVDAALWLDTDGELVIDLTAGPGADGADVLDLHRNSLE